jgi:aldose 1-epimerase
VRLSLESQDGDQGFPGNLSAAVTYGLTADGELRAEYEAKVDQPCPVNLTNHAYFNLNGEGNGSILSHEAQIFASRYVEVDSGLIPTGKLPSVRGSPFDFTQPKAIGRDTKDGYDHCFVLDEAEEEMKPAAKVCEENSGICMELRTTQKGVQFYTGNFLDGIQGKPGSVYGKHSGFCLETEGFPDSPNHSDFPQDIYGPGRDYKEKAVFKFTF